MASIPANSWWHQKGELELFAKSFDPAARLSLKTGWVWKFGALRTFATTIGRTMYIPANWTPDAVQRVIPHEVLGHVKQFRYAGLGIHPTLGIFPGMFFFYALMFFPIFLAWGRYRLELHADTKSWQYHLNMPVNNWSPAIVRARAERFAKLVGGKEYLYSVPRPWAVWGFKRRAEKVIKEATK